MAYYYKRKGSWYWRISRTVDGKRKPLNSKGGFKIKSAAVAEAEQVEFDLKHGNYVEQTDQTFFSYYKEWVARYKDGKQSPATDAHYKVVVSMVKKYFSDTLLSKLSRDDYQDFINEFGKGHAPSTVDKYHHMIKAAIIDALHTGKIKSDPTYRVTMTGNKDLEQAEEDKFIPFNFFGQLMREAERRLKPIYLSNYVILTMGATGLRISEALGLTWDCVDFDKNQVTVNKTWLYNENPQHFGPTKNKQSMRTISIDPHTLNILRSLYDYQQTLKQHVKDFNPNNHVFTKRDGFPVSPAGVNKQLIKLELALGMIHVIDKVDKVTIYDHKYTSHALRHTHASSMILTGRNIKFIQKRLGHESIITTMNIYGHLFDEVQAKEDAANNKMMATIYDIRTRKQIDQTA
ncbi:tyrosine-type recombinase/integrase [Loigolactobacillus coryniformis]|uniref:tyrosine-type recombinase/integrase n=1 Tax=Loigolactobacillus TaxID=2767889 RepID=UPI0013DE3A31|nr:site-specific integrase [Loigolactobacillus zhaoyuanensis]